MAALRAATRAAALGAMPEEAAGALFTELIARMRRAQVFTLSLALSIL